jgi:[NiFe] hydrogenase diaphorase moiety large subunit
MTEQLAATVQRICTIFGNDKSRMMDIVRDVQAEFGCVSDEAIDLISEAVNVPRVTVEGTITFYAFLSKQPKGKIVIRVCDDVVDRMNGSDSVIDAFTAELGIAMGETTEDGAITLETAPCIGMCDQAPAALVNDTVVTNLSGDKARDVVQKLRETGDPAALVSRLGDGVNAHDLVNSMVNNNIRRTDSVLFGYADDTATAGLKKALAMHSVEVINEIKNARLRGRGGAGFPTGMKWEFTRGADGDDKVIICNADEGEPGTFKDRVILTERAHMMFEGMTIAGYAIGAQTGILYLRGEYAYLRPYLESVLESRRSSNFLGTDILGKSGFTFDIRIQMGAGAYICGEETALISSCEGLRGDPKNRPPFPAQKGYLQKPTSVNNVETFCCTVRIMQEGAAWFDGIGSKESAGTKLLSISGDCHSPGVYEYPFGVTLRKILDDVGAADAKAVQMGGPSGQLVAPDDFDRIICFDDLATGGSIVVFGPKRSILEVVDYYMDFFIEESCGYCTPCRVGNVLLKRKLDEIIAGKGEPSDLAYLEELGNAVKLASRCGMGQTSPNPILTSLKNFRSEYEEIVKEDGDGFQPTFDLDAELGQAEILAGRKSVHFED